MVPQVSANMASQPCQHGSGHAEEDLGAAPAGRKARAGRMAPQLRRGAGGRAAPRRLRHGRRGGSATRRGRSRGTRPSRGRTRLTPPPAPGRRRPEVLFGVARSTLARPRCHMGTDLWVLSVRNELGLGLMCNGLDE